MLGAERRAAELTLRPQLALAGKKHREIKIDRGLAAGGRRLGEIFAARSRVSAHRLQGGGNARPFAAREVFAGSDFLFDLREGVADIETERGRDLASCALEPARLEPAARGLARAHRF